MHRALHTVQRAAYRSQRSLSHMGGSRPVASDSPSNHAVLYRVTGMRGKTLPETQPPGTSSPSRGASVDPGRSSAIATDLPSNR